jgi:predicted amidophosphoribosyltransferase
MVGLRGGMRLKKTELCDRCGHDMKEIQPCHLICPNCGSHLDCTDKGNVW